MDARFSDKLAINTHTALTVVALHVYVRSGLYILFQMIGNILKILFLLYTLISSIEVTGQGRLINKPQKTMKWVCILEVDCNQLYYAVTLANRK